MLRRPLYNGLIGVLVSILWMVPPVQAQCTSNSNCQIILSGTGLSASPTPPCTPWGLWLWSQPSNNNLYGNGGEGSMYFYKIAPAEAHVAVSDVVLSGGAPCSGSLLCKISESASGTFPDGTSLSCTLSAHETSPGSGILDSMDCTVGNHACTTADIPITFNISNVK